MRKIGIVYFVLGVVEMAIAVMAVGVIAYVIVIWSADPGHRGDSAITLPLVAAIALAYPVPSIVAGRALMQERPIGRSWLWWATFLHLLNFPVGTVAGVLGIIVFSRQ